jgi:hypothetical protein
MCGTLEYLDTASCIKAYSVDFLSGRRNLLLVMNATTSMPSNGSILGDENSSEPFQPGKWGSSIPDANIFATATSTFWNTGFNTSAIWDPNQLWCKQEDQWVANTVNASYNVLFPQAWLNSVSNDNAGYHGTCSLGAAVSHAADFALELYVISVNGTESYPVAT